MNETVVLEHLTTQIRERVAKRGMTMEELATAANVSKSMLYAVLKYERTPNIVWVAKIADGLGCRVKDLVP